MTEFLGLLKEGNKSALMASIMNAIIAIIKAIAFFITGNVAMFAEMMHSIGDTANQSFVFIGSALSKKAPTDRFPGGFARLVNLVLLGAVLIVGILAYETVKEGIHHIIDPPESNSWFWLNIAVLGVAAILESVVLVKAMKEITADMAGEEIKGFRVVIESFKNIGDAKPATKLVFLEDMVATGGALIAILSIVIGTYTPFHEAEGYASVIIGLMLFYVVGRVFLDNAAGVLGVSDEEMEKIIGELVFAETHVKDIQEIMVIKEGEELHVELKVEFDPDMSIANAADILKNIEEKILNEKGVTEVIIESDQDDKVQSWNNPDKDT
ncbi:cation diffusion facilitator family transporter [Halobacillus hunanensis]|uniref:cation diffusion facilitator family transporter n=1 Tax=Halobacillus hunanensis TaxID=578214 RepID=UPI0009A72407|nr:cation diffusion facilitator family transporter [Halobacillus hunanensis]